MRKVLLLFLLALSLQVSAQGTKFMGLTMEGTAKEFAAKLVNERGFVQKSGYLEGRLEGRDVSVSIDGYRNKISSVFVSFGSESCYQSAVDLYNILYNDLFYNDSYIWEDGLDITGNNFDRTRQKVEEKSGLFLSRFHQVEDGIGYPDRRVKLCLMYMEKYGYFCVVLCYYNRQYAPNGSEL